MDNNNESDESSSNNSMEFDKDNLFSPINFINSLTSKCENKGSWRVKLYKLDEKGNWQDIATGNAFILMNVIYLFYFGRQKIQH